MLRINKREACFLAVAGILSLVFTKYYFLLTSEYYPPAYSEKIAAFEADKVFQKRFLIPLVAKQLNQVAGISLDRSLKILVCMSAFGLLISFREMLRLTSAKSITPYASLGILIPVGWNYLMINSIFHAYDIPSIFIFCTAICLFMNGKYVLFYVTFAIGTLNRESTCFISVALLLMNWKGFIPSKDGATKVFRENKAVIIHMLAQFLMWLTITKLIAYACRNNPGFLYEGESTYSMIKFMNDALSGKPSWPFLDTSAFLSNPISFLTLFMGTWLLIPIYWKWIPISAKKLLLFIPIYLIPALLYANLMESRVYHEINVVIALACITGLNARTKAFNGNDHRIQTVA
jgi:hypothetical protein